MQGNSLSVAAGSQWMRLPASPDFDLGTDPFTILGWIFPRTGSSGSTLWSNQLTTNRFIIFHPNDSSFFIRVNNSNVVTGGVTIPNVYQLLSVTRNGNQMEARINGIQTGAQTGALSVSEDFDLSTVINGVGGHSVGNNWNGKLDQFALYGNRLLQVSDFVDLHNNFSVTGQGLRITAGENFPTSGNSMTANLRVLLRLNQSSGSIAPDAINSNDGTLINMSDASWFIEDGPVPLLEQGNPHYYYDQM